MSCETTDIFLNPGGDLSTFTGTWVTENYINVTQYLANPITADGDITYRDTTVVDSTTLTFVFGAARPDSVQVTAVTTLMGVKKPAVNLAKSRWSFTLGTSTGDEKSGVPYFLIYQLQAPGNTANGYGTSYTYQMLTPGRMNIKWVSTNSTSYKSLLYEATLIKQ